MAHRLRNRIVARILLVGLAWAISGLAAPPALAAPAPAELDADAEQRFLIEQLTAEKAITVARERRLADADQERLYEQLASKDRKLRTAVTQAEGNEAELARLGKERAKIARQRRALIEALAEQSDLLATEVRAYRKAVTEIASSPDPRKLAALQQFADGHQREALAVLDEIAAANRIARQKAADVAEAEERRPNAWLTLQAHDDGEQTLAEAIERFEEVTRLDPRMTWDFVELAWLYEEQGRLDAAENAARQAHASLADGGDPRARAAVLDVLGNMALKAGDLPRAKAHFDEGLVGARTLAERDPTSTQARRDLAIILDDLGEVAVRAGDLELAEARFAESLAIARALAEGDPSSAEGQRDLAIALERLGEVAMRTGDLPHARACFEESLAIARTLAKHDPKSAEAQRDLAIALERLGQLAVKAGDLPRAEAQLEKSLAIARKLARRDASAAARRHLGIGLERLGDVAVLAGDLPRAKARYRKQLAIARELAAGDPASAEAQRDLLVALARLGRVTRDQALVNEALDIGRKLDDGGRLAAGDRELLERLSGLVAALP